MSKKSELLTTRNAIIASAAVLIVSVIGTALSMLRPNDSGGMARDSFGTRAGGYRALAETLDELGVRTTRNIAPPEPSGNGQTLVLFDPNDRLVAIAPKYLQALNKWVEDGGRIVVTPSASQSIFNMSRPTVNDDDKAVSILAALGLSDEITVEESEDVVEEDYTAAAKKKGAGSRQSKNKSPKSGWPFAATPRKPSRDKNVLFEGSLAPLAKRVKSLAIPGEGIRTLVVKDEDLAGAARCNDSDGAPHLIAAVLKRGQGEIVVVSDPALFSNVLIAEADNSVFAVNLLSPDGEEVVFDEFYHGLAVRGNALYLLTRPGFATATAALLLVIGVATWRAAIFLGPPLSDTQKSRRDVGEYVSAMADFFWRGRGSRRFVAREVRDGVLRQLCQELKLPMDTLELGTISAALARRDCARAERLEIAVREADAILAGGGDCPRSTFLPLMQRLTNCL